MILQPINNGASISKDGVTLYITVYREDIIRCSYIKDGYERTSTPAVVGMPLEVEYAIEENCLATNKLRVLVNQETLGVEIYDKEDNLLQRDINTKIDTPKHEKKLLWEKGIYGLGEKYGYVNKLGSDTINWCSDVLAHYRVHSSIIKDYHTAINFYIGMDENKAYGLYYDNSYRTLFDFDKDGEGVVSYSSEGGELDYYFIYGDDVSQVVEGYTYITGRMPLPRRDFLGYQQCRWSYRNQEEVLDIAKTMRAREIPCDVIYLDIHYMDAYKVFTTDPVEFKDFEEMVKELQKMNFKLVVIVDPGVKVEEGYSVYDEGLRNGYFVRNQGDDDIYVGEVWPGPAAYPDYLRSDVRKWWGQLHSKFVDLGIEGYWNDMNEPSDFTTETKTIPVNTIHRDDEGNIHRHEEIHNMYGFLEAKSTYEGLRELNSGARQFLLTRAAFAGSQRYAALWTGDNTSIWEHLEMSMPMMMNVGLSGISFVGGDVGGFAEDSNGELVARWTQLGAFTPLFRNHSALDTKYQEPWKFNDRISAINKKYIELRYSLITYLYNLMKESSRAGTPVIRPLFYHYQDDINTHNIYDQFLYGRDMMICPIYRPRTNKRMVYLPRGTWYDFWTKEAIEGGRHIMVDAELEDMPIFVRAGAILPRDEVKQFVSDTEEVRVEIYAGENNSYDLYMDDGVSLEYLDGIYSSIEITTRYIEDKLELSFRVKEDGYRIPGLRVNIFGCDKDISITENELDISII